MIPWSGRYIEIERDDIMEIKTFNREYLEDTKKMLKDVFYRENSDEYNNEWEFVENILRDPGYRPELCLVALDGTKVIGYNILTIAKIDDQEGLSLGPLGVRRDYQNKGVGNLLVNESIRRAKCKQYPWILVLGGAYYQRFGFEPGQSYGIVVSDDDFLNNHIQILFLNEDASRQISGKVKYCDLFYDKDGNLI